MMMQSDTCLLVRATPDVIEKPEPVENKKLVLIKKKDKKAKSLDKLNALKASQDLKSKDGLESVEKSTIIAKLDESKSKAGAVESKIKDKAVEKCEAKSNEKRELKSNEKHELKSNDNSEAKINEKSSVTLTEQKNEVKSKLEKKQGTQKMTTTDTKTVVLCKGWVYKKGKYALSGWHPKWAVLKQIVPKDLPISAKPLKIREATCSLNVSCESVQSAVLELYDDRSHMEAKMTAKHSVILDGIQVHGDIGKKKSGRHQWTVGALQLSSFSETEKDTWMTWLSAVNADAAWWEEAKEPKASEATETHESTSVTLNVSISRPATAAVSRELTVQTLCADRVLLSGDAVVLRESDLQAYTTKPISVTNLPPFHDYISELDRLDPTSLTYYQVLGKFRDWCAQMAVWYVAHLVENVEFGAPLSHGNLTISLAEDGDFVARVIYRGFTVHISNQSANSKSIVTQDSHAAELASKLDALSVIPFERLVFEEFLAVHNFPLERVDLIMKASTLPHVREFIQQYMEDKQSQDLKHEKIRSIYRQFWEMKATNVSLEAHLKKHGLDGGIERVETRFITQKVYPFFRRSEVTGASGLGILDKSALMLTDFVPEPVSSSPVEAYFPDPLVNDHEWLFPVTFADAFQRAKSTLCPFIEDDHSMYLLWIYVLLNQSLVNHSEAVPLLAGFLKTHGSPVLQVLSDLVLLQRNLLSKDLSLDTKSGACTMMDTVHVDMVGLLGPSHPLVARYFQLLASVLFHTQSAEHALGIQRRAVEASLHGLGKRHPWTRTAVLILGCYALMSDALDEAIHLFTELLEAVSGPLQADVAFALSEAYSKAGDRRLAIHYASQCKTIREMCLGQDHPHTILSYHQLGNLSLSMIESPQIHRIASMLITKDMQSYLIQAITCYEHIFHFIKFSESKTRTEKSLFSNQMSPPPAYSPPPQTCQLFDVCRRLLILQTLLLPTQTRDMLLALYRNLPSTPPSKATILKLVAYSPSHYLKSLVDKLPAISSQEEKELVTLLSLIDAQP